MGDQDLPALIAAKEAEVTKQGDTVRALKSNKGKSDDAATAAQKADEIAKAIDLLKQLKKELGDLTKQHAATAAGGGSQGKEKFRAKLASTLEQNLFYIPAFKIYGGVAGLYDYGPTGAAVKNNLQTFWRQHFILEENMLEIECPSVTPHNVLKASGHVDRFIDLMVHDTVTKTFYRADHLLKDAIEKQIEETVDPAKKKEHEVVANKIDEYTAEELGALLTQYGVKAPETGNDICEPYPFNLMFKTQIGPAGHNVGYLRPETAQGIFVNFRDLLYHNGNKLPFAAAQIGQSFRNEISPRAGLLRVREFTQMEIEHFVNPDDKSHKKFGAVRDLTFLLYPREQQKTAAGAISMNLGEAVQNGTIANETLAYFIGRTFEFLKTAGINTSRLRFRQHLEHEMAHYAQDCWDAEIECTYGWVECVGLADRSAYDLDAHSKASGVDLNAFQKFDTPVEMEVLEAKPEMKELGKVFKKEAGAVKTAIMEMTDDQKEDLQAALEADGAGKLAAADGITKFDITPAMIKIQKVKKKVHGKTFTPGVIEPSFGIGRIIYCLYEHCYYTREGDEQRTVFKFSPTAAPIKCTVFPLLQKKEFEPYTAKVASSLLKLGLSRKVDESGITIGKRYARTDEIGVPFAVTVDPQTIEDNTVTLRERDTMDQVRLPLDEVAPTVRSMCDETWTWADVLNKYPKVEAKEEK
eukprot:CAMPEP_0197849318 /NCGR_PEP_ID=MMETSP1438-20131217/11632_1 /TAXON_ID=1461541 /ORGANISM="Pterosperma sp., Strain CCMP1384" /LENGTH=694 /DNA_ID=CAMNT_0043461941 /DNA_START=107 /DNA_END=2191 /DNA_ORIENTATION=-